VLTRGSGEAICADSGGQELACGLAHRDFGTLRRQLQRSIDQHAAEVTVMIGPGFRRLAAGARLGRLSGGHGAA